MVLPHFCCGTSKTLNRILFFVFALLLITICVNLLSVPTVDVDVQTSQPGLFQIFWTNTPGVYVERHSGYQRDITPAVTHYRFNLSNLHYRFISSAIKYLRIDPLDRPGEILIKKIHISQGGLFTLDLDSAKDFHRVKIITGIKEMQVTKEGLRVVTFSADPQLEVKVSFVPHYGALVLFFAGGLLLLYTLKYIAGRLVDFTCYTECFFFFVLALILTMAVISRPNMHPDELLHMAAASYYQDNHWLPPAAEDRKSVV